MVLCPFCDTPLDGSHVDVTAWVLPIGMKLRFKRAGAQLFERTKVLGAWSRRPAGLCPSCEAILIAPIRRPQPRGVADPEWESTSASRCFELAEPPGAMI